MRQEYATQYGKVIRENGTLYVRSYYVPFAQTALAELGVELVWLLSFAMIIGLPYGSDAKTKARIITWCILIAFRIPTMYKKFFKRSWSSRIPLSRIKSFETVPDEHNLVTTVNLHFTNGRYRPIPFRTNETALADFTAMLASVQPSLVVA
jgi:hypothetical protein